ncbi:MAG: heme-binding protein [Patescibacteria group bacterium]|nr:heme-binding protein [Patescibacteria group bacterium]
MLEKRSLSLKEAEILIEAAMDNKLVSVKTPVAVAVVDESGSLIMFSRMDGVNGIGTTLSQNKAYTAALFGLETEGIEERLAKAKLSLLQFTNKRFTSVGGGYPIKDQNGQVIGALGVSGMVNPSDDRKVAKIAASLMMGTGLDQGDV